MWPGILLLVTIAVASTALITYGAIQAYNKKEERTREVLPRRKRIRDANGNIIWVDEDDLDEPGIPTRYPDKSTWSTTLERVSFEVCV